MARELRRLRSLAPGARIDLKELVILGAREKAARLEADEGHRPQPNPSVEDFLALRGGDELDVEAALSLHDSGWSRSP